MRHLHYIVILLSITILIAGCGQKENKNLVKARDLIVNEKYSAAQEEIQLALSAESKNVEVLCLSEILAVIDKKNADDWSSALKKVLQYIDEPLKTERESLNEKIADLESRRAELDDDELEELEGLIRQRNFILSLLVRAIDAAHGRNETWVQELALDSTEFFINVMLESGKSFDPMTRESVDKLILQLGDIAIDPLIAALKNSHPDIRRQAVLLLGKLRTPRAIAPISELLNKNENFEVLYNIPIALEMIGGQEIVQPLRNVLKSDAAQARVHAAVLLGKLKTRLKTESAIPDLIKLLADDNSYVTTVAINVLTSYGESVVAPLLAVLEQNSKSIIPDVADKIEEAYIANAYIDEDKIKSRRNNAQIAAMTTLGNIRATEARQPLIKLLDDDDLRTGATAALTAMGGVAVEELIQTLNTKTAPRNLRINAASILGNINDRRAVNFLTAALNDSDKDVRANAVEALGKMKVRDEENSAVKALAETLSTAKDEKTKNSTIVALGNIAAYDAKAVDELLKIATDRSKRESLRSAAITALTAIKPEEAVAPMIKIMLDDDESDVLRKGAATALGEIKDTKAVPPMLWILSTLRDEIKDFQRKMRSLYRTVDELNAAIKELNVDWEPNYRTWSEVKPIPSLVRSEVAIALGKIKGDDVVEPLIKALEDDKRAVVRKSAAWALGEIVNPKDKIIPALEDALRHDDRGIVRNEAAVALGKIKGAKVVDALVHALKKDKYETTRKSAAIGLREVAFDDAVEGLVDVLKDQAGKEEEKRETEAVLGEIVTALIKDGAMAVKKPLLSALESDDETVRKRAAHAIGTIADASALDALIDTLKDDSVIVRERAAALLGNLKRRKAVQPLIDVLANTKEWKSVRAKAAASLGTLRDEAALPHLLDALEDENAEIRASAATALGKLKDVRPVEQLISLVEDSLEDTTVRNNAITALGNIDDTRAETVLLTVFRNETGIPQHRAITALGKLKSTTAVPELIRILNDREANPAARINAATALGKIKGTRAVKSLEERLLDETEYNITMVVAVKHKKFFQAVADAVRSFTLTSENVDEKLISCLTDTWEHDPVRIAAAKALGRTGTDKAIEQLKDTLANDTVEGVRQAAGLALGETERKDMIPTLVEVMKSPKATGDGRGATQGLGEIADPSTIPDLVAIMQDTTVAIEIRRDAAVALGKIKSAEAEPALISELKKEGIDKTLKLNIIGALGKIKSQAAVAELEPLLADEDADFHFTVADALFKITGDEHGYNW